ncbi:hypothetical protein D9611_005213 [Ephemerocybe angulata]|uniref:Uncharacterized protein n=1 Tax=Ephemerocybe angulata TaxID=980116 RepID=A0A8H5C026_9AGAR|nr:hypothetical protein D9611_005213 [Tulosesus angulatus]
MNKNAEATQDCRKALDLDPDYGKAWGRLGKATQALNIWDASINAFQKALDLLPKDNLTALDRKSQVEYAEGIAKTKALRSQSNKVHNIIPTAQLFSGRMPWDMAAALTPKKIALGKPSCVFILNYAYETFKKAITRFSEEMIEQSSETKTSTAKPNLVKLFSDVILADHRVFNLPSAPDFHKKLTKAAASENDLFRGWAKQGPATVKKEVLQRLETETWETVSPAIEITIRSWIFFGFLKAHVSDQTKLSQEMYANALDVLQWGLETFPDVPNEERGMIFAPEFVRVVKRLYLIAMREDIASFGTKSMFSSKQIVPIAQDIVDTVDEEMPNMQAKDQVSLYQSGHFYAHWVYPVADALAALGWCQFNNIIFSTRASERLESILTAAQYYLDAAKICPDDDDRYITYMRMHLDCLFAAKKPLRDTLPICKRIQEAIPPVLQIWGLAPGAAAPLKQDLKEMKAFEKENSQRIAAGKLTLDSFAMMTPVQPTPLKIEMDPEFPFKVKEPNFRRGSKTKKYKANVV